MSALPKELWVDLSRVCRSGHRVDIRAQTRTVLDLSSSSIGDQGASILSQKILIAIGNNTNSNNGCGNGNGGGNFSGSNEGEGGSLPKGMATPIALRRVYLSRCDLGDQGVSSIARAFASLKSLVFLDLHGNSCGDTGALSVAKYLIEPGGTSLECVSLEDNLIGSVGATALLSSLRRNGKILSMWLDGNDGIEGKILANIDRALVVRRSVPFTSGAAAPAGEDENVINIGAIRIEHDHDSATESAGGKGHRRSLSNHSQSSSGYVTPGGNANNANNSNSNYNNNSQAPASSVRSRSHSGSHHSVGGHSGTNRRPPVVPQDVSSISRSRGVSTESPRPSRSSVTSPPQYRRVLGEGVNSSGSGKNNNNNNNNNGSSNSNSNSNISSNNSIAFSPQKGPRKASTASSINDRGELRQKGAFGGYVLEDHEVVFGSGSSGSENGDTGGSSDGDINDDGKKYSAHEKFWKRGPASGGGGGDPLSSPSRTRAKSLLADLTENGSSPPSSRPRPIRTVSTTRMVHQQRAGRALRLESTEDTEAYYDGTTPASQSFSNASSTSGGLSPSVGSPSGSAFSSFSKGSPGRRKTLSRASISRAGESGGGPVNANLNTLRSSRRGVPRRTRSNQEFAGSSGMVRPAFREIDFFELEFTSLVGGGSFGKVYRGRWLGTEVAIKKLYYEPSSRRAVTDSAGSDASEGERCLEDRGIGSADHEDTLMDEFYREVRVLSNLRHPNIVLLMGACSAQDQLCIVTEYLDGGDLGVRITSLEERSERLPLDVAFSLAKDIARGMNYLHSSFPMIIHRDLRPGNIMIDDKAQIAKVGDFGLARTKMFKGMANLTGQVGTPGYTAPEVIFGEMYSHTADVYSFAMILLELAETRRVFPPDMDGMALFQKVSSDPGWRPEIDQETNEAWKELILMCWAEDPTERPSFQDILAFMQVNEDRMKGKV